MVDIGEYVPFFSEEELEDLGINEKVRFSVLTEVLESAKAMLMLLKQS